MEDPGKPKSIWSRNLSDVPGFRWMKILFPACKEPPMVPRLPVEPTDHLLGAGLPQRGDLANMPVIGAWFRRWQDLMVANSSVRREAKALMYGELGEALKQGMPLDTALSLNSQNLKEHRRPQIGGHGQGADRRHPWLYRFLATLSIAPEYFVAFSILLDRVFWFVCWPVNWGLFLYSCTPFCFTDAERVARLFANRLREHVSKGFSLSEAMRKCGRDFDEPEIAIAEMGEQLGNLGDALWRLSRFHTIQARLSYTALQVSYPIQLAIVLSLPIFFVVIAIIPKFADIYNQLGMVLPAWTQGVIESSWIFSRGFIGLLLMSSVLLLLVRHLMNGHVMARYFIGLGLVGYFAAVFLQMAFLSGSRSYLTGGDYRDQDARLEVAFFFACGIGAFIVVMPWVIGMVERLVLWAERWTRAIILKVGVLASAVRAERESRWLAALAISICGGMKPHEALRMAGMTIGGSCAIRSFKAAILTEKGLPIGQACLKARVLAEETNHRLALIDSRMEHAASLQDVAEDRTLSADHLMTRAGRLGEAAGIVLLGGLVAAFVIGIYMPLFYIPTVVGRY
ncbi:MAG: type II secretion system F family protein [Candidatus Sumerlaeaceae bacterium]|nr:type II secretion system F family protein [Candidatus Sumerlaeaceae bacterium]